MAVKHSRKSIRIKRKIFVTSNIITLLGIIILLVNFAVKIVNNNNSAVSPAKPDTVSSEAAPEIKETTATVLSTGDIMVHSTQLSGALVKSTGEYDFSAFFKELIPYFSGADLNVANLEVTFGGTAAGVYSGYPAFNTPDSLADAIKDSGINFLVTANNHSFDTGFSGLKRTAKVLKEKGIEFIGTKETDSDPEYTVKTVNDINIGIANYTYETSPQNPQAGRKYINGNLISSEANSYINSFSYNRIEEFYKDAERVIKGMKQNGAEYIVFYMHWGNEYQTTPNTHQKSIAQRLSNMGVDMIIGSHPHVIQPVELITSEDGQNSTVCLYSTGNAVSNQRQEIMDSCPSGHTEDGMLFSFTLKKDKNGVSLDGLDIIPTWVNRYRGGSGYQYTIYPIEDVEKGIAKYGFDSTAAAKYRKSFDRTKTIIAKGLTECQEFFGFDVTFK